MAEEGTVKVDEESTVNEKAGEGVFKMPKIPRRTPEKKGKGRRQECRGMGKEIRRGKRCVYCVFVFF